MPAFNGRFASVDKVDNTPVEAYFEQDKYVLILRSYSCELAPKLDTSNESNERRYSHALWARLGVTFV